MLTYATTTPSLSLRSLRSRHTLTCSLPRTLLAGSFASLLCSVVAQAQTATAGDEPLEEVVVTGSRIPQPNATSASPIQVISAEEIKLGGRSDISDVINLLPQNLSNSIGQDLGNRTSGLTTAGGVATADLRGLGPNRTLVMVNGRRLGVGSPNTVIQSPAPDLDQIPAALVERVDVLTGGASAVYGSDAIAGVVNFILKDNFQGIQVDYQLGENFHQNHSSYVQGLVRDSGDTPLTGNSRDGRNQSLNILAGTNFADGRGNLTAYFGYQTSNPVKSGDRDFGGCQLNANATLTGAECAGSSNSNWFQPLANGNTNVYSVAGHQFVDYGSASTNPPALFNTQPYIYMARDDERYTAGAMGHLDVSDRFKPYFEFGFMEDKTYQQIAPSALFKDSNPLDANSGNYNINCSNPLLSAQQAALICTPAQIAADTANPGSASGNVQIGRRNIEGGARQSFYKHSNYRGAVGAKGDFAEAWNYDVYAQYYYTSFFNSNDRYLSYQGITNALQVTGTAANPVCISGPPCVPYNIFTDGGVNDAQLNYLYLSGTAKGNTTLRTTHGDITGDLGKYNIKSPLATDGVGVNLGYEHRAEQLMFEPDANEQSGLLAGFGGASVPIDNGYRVDEEFVELRVPLIQNRPGVKDLVFDTGYRLSDYSTAGSVSTYKFEVQYAPITDVRLRSSYQRAIRAPSIIELFNPQSVGEIQFGADPCAPTRDSSNNLVAATASLEQCQNTGVTAAQYGNGGSTNTVPQGSAGQLTQLQGGNTELKPEKADTYSIGFNFTPTALPDFTASVDYYSINIKDEVSTLSANVILGQCLTTGSPTYCSQIVRSNSGGLTGASVASGGYIVQTSINIGAAKVSGIDVQANYKIPLAQRWGSLLLALNGAYLQHVDTTPAPGEHTYDCAGLFGSTCQTVNPRWHHVLRAMWRTPWEVGLTATWRYLSAVKLDNNDPDPSLRGREFQDADGNPAYNYFNARIPSYSYLDLAANWLFLKSYEIRAGINNVFDKDPPIVTSEITSGGAANSYEVYDGLGRQLFVALTAKF